MNKYTAHDGYTDLAIEANPLGNRLEMALMWGTKGRRGFLLAGRDDVRGLARWLAAVVGTSLADEGGEQHD